MPQVEGAAWQKLWPDVAALLKKARWVARPNLPADVLLAALHGAVTAERSMFDFGYSRRKP